VKNTVPVNMGHFNVSNVYITGIRNYTPLAVRDEPEPALRYPSIRARLSAYLYENSGHIKIKMFPRTQKNFREQWSVPKCEWTIE